MLVSGGDYRFNIPGRYIDTIIDEEKLPENDADVVFEGDNWIGMNVTILNGVTVGFGSVIAASSVVTKSIPPYSIAGGVPAKVLKKGLMTKKSRSILIIFQIADSYRAD